MGYEAEVVEQQTRSSQKAMSQKLMRVQIPPSVLMKVIGLVVNLQKLAL